MGRWQVVRMARVEFAAVWVLAVLVGAAGLDVAPASAATGPETETDSRVVDTGSLLEELETLERTVQTWREAAEDGAPATGEAVIEELGADASPERIYLWVREHVAFEPYRGAMRGPEQVLALRAGNAVDQARLLATLYDRAGVDYRYAFGSLRETAAVEVLEAYAGRLGDVSADDGSSKLFTPRPAYTSDEFLRRVDSHAWLEVEESGGSFSPADPVAASEFGHTPGEAETRSTRLPERHRSRIEIRLVATLEGGRKKSLITVETGFERIAFEPVHFTVEPSQVQGAVVPRIALMDRTATGERFAPSKLRRLAVEYDTDVGNHERHFERVLYTDAGGAFRAGQTVATALVVPGWASGPTTARQVVDEIAPRLERVGERLEEEPPESTELPADALESLLAATGTASAFARALHADAVTARLAAASGVRPVQAAPRVLHAVVSASEEVSLAVDARGAKIRGVPARGVTPRAVDAFRTLRGYAVDAFEAELVERVTGEEYPSVQDVLDRARLKGISVRTLHGRNADRIGALEVASPVASQLRRDVRENGRTAIVPERPVEVEGERRFAWWALQPNGATVRGVYGSFAAGFFERTAGASDGGISVGASLNRAARLVTAGIEGGAGYDPVICNSLDHARSMGASFCSSENDGTSSGGLSCGSDDGSSEDESDEIGVVGIGPATCTARTRRARCGARAAETLLSRAFRVDALGGDATGVAPGRVAPAAEGGVQCEQE